MIWLHDLGDTAWGNFDVFAHDYEINPINPTTKVILMTAPIKPVTMHFSMVFFILFLLKIILN